MSKTYIVDGNSLLFRAYFATAYTGNLMTNKDGIPTNALFAFHKLIKEIKSRLDDGDHLFVSFDTGKPTFRKQEFTEYKAQRAPVPNELVMQMPLARDMLSAMNIHWNELEGYEGDDLAGSMAKYAASLGDEVRLYTSDKDFLQLCGLDEKITVEMLKKGLSETVCYTKDNIHELFGLNADQITDYKGIAGDSSDNYKGIKGVGDKTAMKLLNEHGTLENIIEYCKANPTASKINQKFIDNEKEALFFKKLATIDTALDMKEDYEKSSYKHYQKTKLMNFYSKYQLSQFAKNINSLKDLDEDNTQLSLDDLFSEEKASDNEIKTKERKLIKIESFSQIKNEIKAFVIDSNKENENIADILNFVFADDENIYLLPLEKAKDDETFKKWIEKEDKHLSVYDYKGMYVLLSRYNLGKLPIVDFDLLIATYLTNPDSGQKIDDLFFSYGITLDKTKNIAVEIIGYVLDLKEQVEKELLDNDEVKLFKEIELPLSKVLAEMEIEGFPINREKLSQIDIEYSNILENIEKEIYQIAGKEFNINSRLQLDEVLFTDLGLKRNQGEKGIGIEVLKAHYNDHEIIPLLIKYRLYSKIVSGYTKALPEHILKDEKIHAIYNQALTSTGRLSMSEPNLQNISIRNEEGKSIRKAFYYPDEKYYLLSLDYSQIELRVLASLGNIENLKKIIKEGEDIHRATAALVFQVDKENVTSEMRRRAKAVNFGIVYGITSYGLAQQLDIPVSEAKILIQQFKATFAGIDEFQANAINMAKEKGYVTTIANRRRYFKDINSSNRALRSFNERAAVNTIIQGSAADLIKIAMIKVRKLLENYQTKIVLQIHDELIFKVPQDEIKEIIPLIQNCMEHAIDLDVPLKVDGTFAKTWYEAH